MVPSKPFCDSVARKTKVESSAHHVQREDGGRKIRLVCMAVENEGKKVWIIFRGKLELLQRFLGTLLEWNITVGETLVHKIRLNFDCGSFQCLFLQEQTFEQVGCSSLFRVLLFLVEDFKVKQIPYGKICVLS